jgi:leader peptidase (prepilin peptidase)/N-methyltransferase
MAVARAKAAPRVVRVSLAKATEPASGKHGPLPRHPKTVAVVASACAVLAFTTNRAGAGAVTAAFLAAVLVALAASDLDRRVIPNRVVLPAIALALVAHAAADPASVLTFATAAMAAGAVFLLPSLTRRPWMGMGDVKVIMLLGAGLGAGVVGAVAVAFLSLFPFAVMTTLRRGLAARSTALPFGPSLALGGLFMLLAPHLLGG